MKIIIKDKNNQVIKVYDITNPIQVSVIAHKHEFWEWSLI